MSDERKISLGEFLKSEREKRGLTIEQTSSATKIGLKILKQLEADQYSELPALPFVRGFIRNYGKFLGIDGEKLLAEYSGFLEDHSRERPKRDAGHSGYAFERPDGEQSRKILWGVMVGMLFFGGVVVFVFKPSLKQKHHGHVDKLKVNPKLDDEVQESLVAPEASSSPGLATSPTPSPSGLPSMQPSPVAAPSPFVLPKVPLVLASPEDPKPKPSATAVASPEPSPSAAPLSKPSPVHTTVVHTTVPTPVPTTVASPVPTPAVSLTPEEALAKDKLQSGADYAPKEIKYKVVFRTKADVWVRYQCDDKKLMKFALKKDRILVLRGKSEIWFQTSNAAAVTFSTGSGSQPLLSESDRTFDYMGNPTLVWPPELREKIESKFKVGKPLPVTDNPVESIIGAPETPAPVQ